MDKETIDEIALHLLKTITFKVGRVNTRDLADHFSQLLADLRKKFNSSKEIKSLLMKYPELFIMKKELVNKFPERDLHGFAGASPMRAVSPHINVEIDDDEEEDTEDDDREAEEEDDDEQMSGNVKISIDGKGKIIRKFEKYAFIEYSSYSYTTVIFFDVRTFEDGQHENLEGLKLKEEVYFHAKPSVGHSAPYRATKVWRSGYFLSPQDTRKCYSSGTSIASQDSFQSDDLDGTVEAAKITASYGFIRAGKETQGDDFLYPSKREPPTLEKTKNVDDFLEIEDFVYFSGNKNTAEEVKNSKMPKNATKHLDGYRKSSSGDDFLYPSKREPPTLEKAKNVDDFLEIEDFVYFSGKKNTAEEVKNSKMPKNATKHRTKKKNSKKQVESTSDTTDCSAHTSGLNVSQTNDSNLHSSKSDRMERMANTLYSQVGKIYDLAGNEPVINFGRNEKAIVLPNRVYKNGKLLGELGWELDEGTEVQFDAKHDSGKNWWAELVWIGDKPRVANENNTRSNEDMLHGFGNVSLHDNEHSVGIRRYGSSPYLSTSSWNNPLDESLRSNKNRPRGAKSSKAENYPKIPGGDNSKKKFTKYRKNNNIAEATSSSARGHSDYHQ